MSREAQDHVKDRERRHRQQRYHPYADSRKRDDRGDGRGRDRGQRDYRDRGNEGDGDYHMVGERILIIVEIILSIVEMILVVKTTIPIARRTVGQLRPCRRLLLM